MGTFVRMIVQREENKGVELTGGGGTVEGLWNAEAEGGGEFGLILIEGAEGTGREGECGSYMQDIQSASAEEPGLGSGDAPGMRERGSGNGHDADHACLDIPGERKQDGLFLGSAQLFTENAPVERVGELEFGEVDGEERRLDALHRGGSGEGVGIVDVQRE